MANTKLLEAILHVPTPWGRGLPVVFWGEPGIGKSDTLSEVTEGIGMVLKVLAPGEQGEAGFGTVPMPVPAPNGRPDCMRLATPAPDWADDFDLTAGRGVVFTDELTTAPAAIQPALMGLLLARRIGNTQLPKTVRMVGAANPLECLGGAGHEFISTIANRLGHFQWQKPTNTEWCSWMLGENEGTPEKQSRGMNVEQLEQWVDARWAAPFARARSMTTAFIRARGELLHKMPPAESPELSRAWPSHRTWTMATYGLAGAIVFGGDNALQLQIMEGFIGEGATHEFAAWMQNFDLPDSVALLDGRTPWTPSQARPDISFAVLAGAAAFIAAEKQRIGGPWNSNAEFAARAGRAWALVDTVAAKTPDVALSAARILTNCGLGVMPESHSPVARLRQLMAVK